MASTAKKSILVYVDCGLTQRPFQLGVLSAYPGSGSEVFAVEYTREALDHPKLQDFGLDPELPLQSGRHHTFLIDRFDRPPHGARMHFASAMTLTGHMDGDGASTGASYQEIARVLIDHGANTDPDLNQLWTRIVFNMLVSNTDDHLRNHGFLFVPGRGWKLAPAYDMNPVPHSSGLALNVSQNDNARDLDLALSVAPVFRVSDNQANEIVARLSGIVRQWRTIAQATGIPNRQQDAMANAFALAK